METPNSGDSDEIRIRVVGEGLGRVVGDLPPDESQYEAVKREWGLEPTPEADSGQEGSWKVVASYPALKPPLGSLRHPTTGERLDNRRTRR